MNLFRYIVTLTTTLAIACHPLVAAAQGEVQKAAAASARWEMERSLARLSAGASYGDLAGELRKSASHEKDRKFYAGILKQNHISPVERVTPMQVTQSGEGWLVKPARGGAPLRLELRGEGPVNIVVNGIAIVYTAGQAEAFWREFQAAAARPAAVGFSLIPEAHAVETLVVALGVAMVVGLGIAGARAAYEAFIKPTDVAKYYEGATEACAKQTQEAQLDFDLSSTGKLYDRLIRLGLDAQKLGAKGSDCEGQARKAGLADEKVQQLGDIEAACQSVARFVQCAGLLKGKVARAKASTFTSVNTDPATSMEH